MRAAPRPGWRLSAVSVVRRPRDCVSCARAVCARSLTTVGIVLGVGMVFGVLTARRHDPLDVRRLYDRLRRTKDDHRSGDRRRHAARGPVIDRAAQPRRQGRQRVVGASTASGPNGPRPGSRRADGPGLRSGVDAPPDIDAERVAGREPGRAPSGDRARMGARARHRGRTRCASATAGGRFGCGGAACSRSRAASTSAATASPRCRGRCAAGDGATPRAT